MRFFIGLAIGLGIIFCIFSFLFPIRGEGRAANNLLVNRSYDDVMKIIVNDPEALEQILVPVNVQVLESSFKEFNIERLETMRRLETNTVATVRINDSSLGNPVIRLSQRIWVDANQIFISVESLDSVGQIEKILSSTKIKRHGGHTVCEMSSYVCIRKRYVSNRYLKSYIDNRISAHLNHQIQNALQDMKQYLESQPSVDNLRLRLMERFIEPGPKRFKWAPQVFGVKKK